MTQVAFVMGLAMALADTSQTHQMHSLEVYQTRQQRVLSSTAPQHVIGREDIEHLSITDISDALQRLPGITLRDYGGAGGMKTVSVRGFGARHTGVSYDGVMLSDCQSGEIDLARYTLDQVQTLSLSVGDADDIFLPARQLSTPALLTIQTVAPPTDDHRAHATAQMRAGSFGYVSQFVRYAQNLNGKLSISAQADYVHADNQYPFTLHNLTLTTQEHRSNSRMDAGHGEAAFVWQAAEHHRLSGKAYWYDNDRQLPGQVHYYTSLSRETLHEQNAFGQMAYLGHLGHGLSVKAAAKANWAMSDYRDPLYTGGVRDAQYWQREGYATAALLFVPSAHWALDYSADYAFNNLNSSLSTDRHPHRHTVWQAATAKWRTTRLTVVGRMLASTYLNRTRTGEGAEDIHHLSPSFSASYQLWPGRDVFARVSYKNIFRAPTFNESYFFHYGSTDLRPESTDQWNIGLAGEASAGQTSVYMTLDGYVNHVKDKILAVPFNMFIWRCINVGSVRVLGLDATARASHRFGSRHTLLATGHYSLQHAQNRTLAESPHHNKQLAYIPLHTGGFALGWDNPWVNLSLHGEGITHRYTTNEHYDGTRVDGYWEWTVTASRTLRLRLRHSVEMRADVKNLLDRQYEIVRLYPMPGRSLLFTLKYQL